MDWGGKVPGSVDGIHEGEGDRESEQEVGESQAEDQDIPASSDFLAADSCSHHAQISRH